MGWFHIGSRKHDDVTRADTPAPFRAPLFGRRPAYDESRASFGAPADDYGRMVRLPAAEPHRDSGVRPPPAVPQLVADPDKQIKEAIKSIQKEVRNMRIDDNKLREEAKELIGQDRQDEADDMLNALVESVLYQKQLGRMVTSIKMFGRNARMNQTNQRVYKAFEQVVHANQNDEPMDMDKLCEDMLSQQENFKEGLEKMRQGIQAASDPTGQMSQEKQKIKQQIVSELRSELRGGAPVVAQPQAVAQNNPLLAQLN